MGPHCAERQLPSPFGQPARSQQSAWCSMLLLLISMQWLEICYESLV